jgi:hypothetical protein
MTSASRFANQARKQFTRVPSPDLSSGFMAAAGLREGRVLVPDFSLGYDSGPAGGPDRRGSTDPRVSFLARWDGFLLLRGLADRPSQR